MNTIQCPNCKKTFEIDESSYAAIAKQVRGLEFDREIALIKKHFEDEKNRVVLELNKKHEEELQKMEEIIAQYKDFKVRLSNKSLGESLEQYCLHEFENIRGLLSSTVSFEKDNDAVDGSKGDFIYRESTEDGIELLSIMFEMKTEYDGSSNKKRNDQHMDKLDRDRKNKNCEYAVLVTTLEAENEYYNRGIVKAPGTYEKMYVVRPQCFLTIISVLRQAAQNTLAFKRELQKIRAEQIDISHFEDDLNAFKTGFITSTKGAADNFNKAIQEINAVIKSLENVRDTLLENSGKKLNAAINKVDKLTVKKLTKNAPAVAKMFEEQSKIEDD